MKKKIYFFESQIPMGGIVYLPYVSGLLQAYAQTFSIIKENYDFQPFIFIRDTVDNIIKKIENPNVMAFSVCIWNHQISLAVAKAVKDKYPKCIIIFGGPQIQKNDKKIYPFIDYIIMREGEKQFVPLLADLINEKLDIPDHKIDDFPSPYTLGLYDRYFSDYPEMIFQAIIETDRSCPFSCSFCYWGQSDLEKKIRYHSFEYIQKEAEWIGNNKIKYIFMANANMGMYQRDEEVANIYVKTKEKYGYPEKIRVCYGKNKEENVYKTAKILHEAGLGKAVTLAKQSHSAKALEAIHRSNIKLTTYNDLALRYHSEGIPTYTEIILGLPGETLESFKKGVDEIADTPTQLFIYHCTVLPNTEMANPTYIEKYGIKTIRVPMTEIHGEIRKSDMVVEYEDIIIETNTMTKEEWIECAVYSWCTQLRCVFGIEDIPSDIIEWFREVAIGVTQGVSRGQVDLRFGNIYWEPEEMAYLRIMLEKGIIGDLKTFARDFVLWGRKSRVHKVKEKVC